MEQLETLSPAGQNEVIRDAFVVVQEVVLDRVRAVPQAEDEVLMTKVGVVLHYVPKDRPVTDRNHWLGNIVGIVPQPHSQAATEQNDFHRLPLLLPPDAFVFRELPLV